MKNHIIRRFVVCLFAIVVMLAGDVCTLVAQTSSFSGSTATVSTTPTLAAEALAIVSRQKGVFTFSPVATPTRKMPDGPLLGNGDVGVTIGGVLERQKTIGPDGVARPISVTSSPERHRFWISKNDFWKSKTIYPNAHPCPIGGIDVNIPVLVNGQYHAEQILETAEVLHTLKTTVRTGDPPPFTRAGTTIHFRSWVAATENLLVIELSVEGDPTEVNPYKSTDLVGVDVNLWPMTGNEAETATGNLPDGYWAVRRFVSTTKSIALDQAPCKWSSEAAVAMRLFNHRKPGLPGFRCDGWSADRFVLSPGRPVILVAAIVTSEESKTPLDEARRRIAEMTPERVNSLRTTHRQWWREFWSKSFVEIGDPLIEKFYYGSNYLMASCSRNKQFPPTLFGNWITVDGPSWQSDYHLNYNHQAPWWGVFSSNHPELADPYDAPILDYLPTGLANARKYLKVRGVYYDVGVGPKGLEAALMPDGHSIPGEGNRLFHGQKSNAVFCAANMFMRFYHTYDHDYALRVYPFLIEVANFWEDYLKLEDGRYVISGDALGETASGIGDKNNCLSLGLVRMFFKGMLDVSSELGVDAERRTKWRDILDRLSDFPTVVVDGVRRVRGAEEGPAASRVGPKRNSSRVEFTGMVWPSCVLGLSSDPANLKILQDDARGWPEREWINHYNGFSQTFPGAARVGHDPEDILAKLRKQLTVAGFPNLMVFGGGRGIENCSAVLATINEMLLQTHEGVLRLFPVWPREQPARFGQLRTSGAFLVSSELKGGEVKYVKIYSEKGRTCTLVNPWPGKAMDVYRDGKKVETLKGERVVLKTEAGATVVLIPEGAGYDSLHGSMGNSQRTMSHAASVGTTYYVDALVGDDSADGRAAGPWRSLGRVNQQVFAPGDAVLFKAGCRWQGQLRSQGSGSKGHPIRIDRYGEGPLPIIDMGATTGAAVQLSNQEFWEIRHLEITSGAPPAREHRQGILVLGSGTGRVFRHIVVSDCHIHDIWGLLGGRDQGIDSYTSTAILVASPRGEQVATFDEVLIERNLIERVDRSAIIVWTPTKAASATRVVVRHNRMTNLGGDAILILGSKGALVEYNVVNHAGLRCGDPNVVLPDGLEGYNACAASIWMHTCDHSLMQFNEVYNTNVQGNNQDGQAFDFDFDCRHCVLQYNYSRHNRGGWLLIMPSAEHNIARFNVSENDQVRLMCGGSSLEADNHLYNNVFYVDCGTVEVFTNAVYTNNIFYATGQGRFKISKRKPGLLSHNVYFGPWLKLPEDAHAMLEDPRFVAAGTGGMGLDSLTGYRLRTDSPCRNRGMPIANSGGRDFWGNPLAEGEKHIGP